jgi:cell division protein FtsB
VNKALLILSIVIFLITYSIGLTLYGPFGRHSYEASAQHIQELEQILQDAHNISDQLEDRKQMLENPHWIRYMAQRYGYVLPGDTIIVYPEKQLEQIQPFHMPSLPVREPPDTVYTNTLIMAVSAGIALLFYLLSLVLLLLWRRSLKD